MDNFPDIGAPDWGLDENPSADVHEVTFGDGYVLRAPKGINHIRDEWSPVWSGLESSVARSTYAWLRSRLKITPFLWEHPVTGETVQVVCTGTKLSYDGFNNEVLSATFRQDFNPA